MNANFVRNPFNLTDVEYLQMFAASAPDKSVMGIFLLTEPGNPAVAKKLVRRLKGQVDLVAARCAVGPMAALVRVPDIFVYGAGTHQDVIWQLMPDHAKSWAVDDVYVQSAYHILPLPKGVQPVVEVTNAMELYDLFVALHNSVEPRDHLPVDVGARYAREWSQAVGDLFKSGVGVWSRALLEHRNMIQIICRALIMGRDPVTEYRRFQASGATYFLDHIW